MIKGEELKQKVRGYFTFIIGHYNPSVRIIYLVSHTTYIVYVNFIHKWRNRTVIKNPPTCRIQTGHYTPHTHNS